MVRIPLLVLLVWLTGCSGVSQLDLLASGRDRWQRPDEVIETLALKPGDKVADLGAGEGYFLPHLARAVGPTGRVYAVDVDSEIVEKLEALVEEESLSNVEVVLGGFQDPGLPDGQLDTVLIVNTYHHIDARRDYFAKLAEDLSDRGRVAVIEPNEDLGGVLGLLLDEGHTSVQADVEREMGDAGYAVARSSDQLPVQIFVIFEPEPRTTP